ncbi:MAG: hypothetical protein OXH98_17290, partial [Caldilineaceae bacterium]|nr:hypothetical protein [Caldilineaceae bacterium]
LMRTFWKKSANFGRIRPHCGGSGRCDSAGRLGVFWACLIACEASTAPAWADCALMRTFVKKSAIFDRMRPLFWLNCAGRGRCEGRNLPRLE